MKRFSQQFKKQGERIVMRASEKEELKARLVSYMEYHPLPAEMILANETLSKKAKVQGIISEPFYAFTFNKIYTRAFSGAFVMFLILGIPALAERAVPGDALYPVKVQFNEELRSTLAISSYAKVEWETQRLERRISEARLLASEGRLTPEAESVVAEAVQTHTDAAQREIAELRETDSDGAALASIAFASALAVQSEVLAGHIGNEGATGTGDYSVVALVDVVAKARTSAETTQTASSLSYEKLLATVEQESTRVYELFESIKKSATKEQVSDVERRLADMERKVAHAVLTKEGTGTVGDAQVVALGLSMSQKTLASDVEADVSAIVATGTNDVALMAEADTAAVAEVTVEKTKEEKNAQEAEAVASLRVTLTDIQKLLNYLSHIDVRENVEINDLVPVVPTTEEKSQEVMRLFEETQALQAKVSARSISSRLQSKVSHGQRQVTAELKKVTTSMEKGNVDQAKMSVESARNLAADINLLTSNEPSKVKGVVEVPTVATSTLPVVTQ